MFLHFARGRLDLALVEVGLGGRLDATQRLGRRRGGADQRRAGPHRPAGADGRGDRPREGRRSSKRGDVAVTGRRRRGARDHAPALRAARRAARRSRAPAPILGWDRDALRVELPGLGPMRRRPARAGTRPRTSRSPTRCSTRSRRPGSPTVPADARRRGYATARWPGRLELRRRRRAAEVLLDGAHNADGAARPRPGARRPRARTSRRPAPLDARLGGDGRQGRRGDRPRRSRRRRRSTARRSCARPSTRRGRCAPAELAAAWRAGAAAVGRTVRVRRRRPRRPRSTTRSATGDGPVVVAGSLYLVGEARARLVDDPLLRDPVADMTDRDARPIERGAVAGASRPAGGGASTPVVRAARRRRRRAARRPDAARDRARDVRLGQPDVRDGRAQRHARLVLRRRAARRGRPGRGGRGAGAADGRRGRRPARRRRRLEPARATPGSTPDEEVGAGRPGHPRRRRARCPATPISIDTTSPAVAAAALDAGAHLLNDVWGVADDPAMVRARGRAAACRSS